MNISSTVLSLFVFTTLLLTSCNGEKSGDKSAGLDDSAISFPPAGGNTSLKDRTTRAFTFPSPSLSAEELATHILGDVVFDRTFITEGGTATSGLGPFFNNSSCRSCHIGNGRGMAVIGDDGGFKSPILTRISIDPAYQNDFPGSRPSPGNGPIPLPTLGSQLQDYSAFGTASEGRVTIAWEELPGSYPDSTAFTLRKPKVTFSGSSAALLNSAKVLRSLRQTPPVFGLGLLEAISDEALMALEDADDKNGDGISGRLNHVWSPETNSVVVGRFGWKASAPTLLSQVSAAFAEDMGVSNPLHPELDGTSDAGIELMQQTAFYTQTLAVPDRAVSEDPAVKVGAKLFLTLHCESCHRSTFTTADTHAIASLRNERISPFTDLLLHDMGEGLSDHRPDFLASGSEWRTAPLWGLGLTHTVLPGASFLHDGRARTIEEAVLWHGGEAEASKVEFTKLTATKRAALISFLKTL